MVEDHSHQFALPTRMPVSSDAISRSLNGAVDRALRLELQMLADYILERIKECGRIFADENDLAYPVPGVGKIMKAWLWPMRAMIDHTVEPVRPWLPTVLRTAGVRIAWRAISPGSVASSRSTATRAARLRRGGPPRPR
jgi:hypothetical protein